MYPSKRSTTTVYRLHTNLVIFVLYYIINQIETSQCHSIVPESAIQELHQPQRIHTQHHHHHLNNNLPLKLHLTPNTQNNVRLLLAAKQPESLIESMTRTQLDEPLVARSSENTTDQDADHHHHHQQQQHHDTPVHQQQQQQQQQQQLPTTLSLNQPTTTTASPASTTRQSNSELSNKLEHSVIATTATTTTATPSSSSSWIERILINVEVMNLLNERRRAKLSSDHKLHDNENRNGGTGDNREHDRDDEYLVAATATAPPFGEEEDAPSSQVPTDSGEDLLDSLNDTTTATAASAATTTTTTAAAAAVLAEAATNDNNGTRGTYQISDGPSVQAQIEYDDQKLVESNNVSAVLSSPVSRQLLSATTATSATKTPTTNNDAFSGAGQVVTVASGSKQSISCEQAYTQCALREVCAPTLKAYNDDCQDLIQNRTSQCSQKCLKAMIALRSSETGDDLANCDCQNNEYCMKSKQRSQICQPEVEKAIEPKTVVSCSVASWICMADQLCSTALGYYYRNCQSLFSQRHCSDYCNNSLAILYRQPKALKLINCQCDGSEDFPCVRYKTYTERLCLNKHHTTTTPTQTDDNDDSQTNAASPQAGDDLPLLTNEDDRLNLTNEPSDMPPLLTHSLDTERESNEDYDPDYNDATGSISDGGDSSIISNNFFEGIQQPAIEDNWIPLVSGRYFTNLHQQQQRRQQNQHKVKQQQQQQQLKSPKPATRRTLKNSKQQKTKSNETKRRQGRPYMFALTSSATPGSDKLMHHTRTYYSWMTSLVPTLLVSVTLIAFL